LQKMWATANMIRQGFERLQALHPITVPSDQDDGIITQRSLLPVPKLILTGYHCSPLRPRKPVKMPSSF
jgi:hypothetical protein